MGNSDLRNIIKNSFYLYLIQGLNYLLPLVTLPYLLIVLSSDEFGKYSFAFAAAQFFILFVDFGFNLSTTKKIAENFGSKDIIKNIYWNITIIKIALFILTLIIAFISIFLFDKLYLYREGILISMLMVIGTALFPVWWFQGLNRMKELSVINIISKILTYPLIFVFVKKSTDSNLAIFFQSLTFFIAGILSIIYIYKTHKSYFSNIRFGSWRNYLDEIKDSWLIFLSNSSISLYTNSLTLLLGFFSTTYNVGLFSAMERIVRVICFGVLGPVNQACFPVIARLKIDNLDRAKKIFKIILTAVCILMLTAFSLILGFKGIIINEFLKDYKEANTLLILFMTMIFPIALGGVLGQLGLLGLGHQEQKKIFSRIYTIVGILSLPLTVLLIYYMKVEGAIYSMLTVELVVFFLMLYFVKKYKYI